MKNILKGTLTEDEKTIEVFSGFSGSGVFRKRGQKLTLVGLLKSLPEENLDYNEITCVSIEDIKSFLDEKIFSQQYKVNKEVIEIIKDGQKLGEITIKTVPITMEDGKILNVSIYPVTFEEYDWFCEDIGKQENKPYSEGFGRGRNPVINISWNNAISYCRWLSEKDNNIYRLLTFDEWINISNQIIFDKDNIWCGEKKLQK